MNYMSGLVETYFEARNRKGESTGAILVQMTHGGRIKRIESDLRLKAGHTGIYHYADLPSLGIISFDRGKEKCRKTAEKFARWRMECGKKCGYENLRNNLFRIGVFDDQWAVAAEDQYYRAFMNVVDASEGGRSIFVKV